MSKATVLQLATDLSLGVADQDEISNYFDEIVREIGFREIFVNVEPITVNADQATYAFSGDHVIVLEVHHNDTGRLSPSSGVSLRAAVGANWRLRRGVPNAFTQDEVSSNELRLFPIPSGPGLLAVVQTIEVDDILEYLELPVALEILHREFMREGSHQDVEFAGVARTLSQFFFTLIDVGTP